MSGPKNIIFKSKEMKTSREIADFFRKLADKMDNNQFTLKQGDQEVNIKLPDSIELELEVEEKQKQRGLKREFEIEMEWYENDGQEPVKLV
jgi:amphi-Trp domain-containing protein